MKKTETEKERLEILRQLEIRELKDEKFFDDINFVASRIMGTPISLVSIIEEDKQYFKSTIGLDATETDRDVAFCAHAIMQDQPLIIDNALNDERFKNNPFVTGETGIRFYAGAQLSVDNVNLGTLCLIDTKPREMSQDDIKALEVLAKIISDYLDSRLNAVRLSSYIENLSLESINISEKMAEKVSDRLINKIAVIDGVLKIINSKNIFSKDSSEQKLMNKASGKIGQMVDDIRSISDELNDYASKLK